MTELHFDFTKSATRAAICETLEAALRGAGGTAQVDASLAAAGVPDRHHRHMSDVMETIDGLARVSDKVRDDMRAIYRILNDAEAKVHGVAADQTHFHEVGEGRGIANALRVCLMIEALAPDRITATCVQVGSGTIRCTHGLLDVPAPATAAIIELGIPVCEQRLEGELCTPTSAAMIYHFVDDYVI